MAFSDQKLVDFLDFEKFCFLGPEKVFFSLRSLKALFLGLFAFFGQKQGVNPFEKKAIFQTLKNCFFLYSERFLSSLKSHQVKLLLVLFDRNQIKKKLTFFGPKAWVNPFGKMRFLGLFFVKKCHKVVVRTMNSCRFRDP